MHRLSRIVLLVACLAASIGTLAFAAPRDPAKEAAIEQELAAIDPSQVAPFREARIAIDRDDFATAEKLLQAVCKRVPDFDAARRRLGSALAAQGRVAAGTAEARHAVRLKRSAANLYTLAYVLAVAQPDRAGPQQRREALEALRESAALYDGNDVPTWALIAHLALRDDNVSVAGEAVDHLEKLAPNETATHYYAALVAATGEHWEKAEEELRKAEKLGLPQAEVQRLLDAGIGSRARNWRLARWTLWTVAGWAAGLGLLFVLGYLLSRLTLRQIEHADPSIAVSAGERTLRKLYRAVVNVAGVYYYVSLPVVLILILAVVVAVFWGCLAAGYLPIKLMLILGLAALATIWTMLRSLFIRVQTREPGRPLQRAEAEGLWRLVTEVAQQLNTKPVDEIRITFGTDLCVYEHGTWREKMNHRAKRVLVIGTAVLPDFQQENFRSVLAHEYGHFAHRDTAGGDVAFRVERDMMLFYYAMVEAGQANVWNVAFHFLRLYHFLFRRISHGATRLQEVLADRIAAQHFGAAAFEGGLRHVIRQNLVFDDHANREIEDAIRAKRPVQNLYTPTSAPAETLVSRFEEAINSPTTADDTHPGPMDRFRLVARVPSQTTHALVGPVWDLFHDRAAVEREMMQEIEKNIARHRS